MYCPECGREVDDDARFCPHCGKNLAVADAEGEQRDEVTEEDSPTPAVPDQPEPAVPPAPEPAMPEENEPLPTSYDSARDDAAEGAIGDTEPPAAAAEPGPQPEAPSPTAAQAPEQQAGQIPPAAPAPPAGADEGTPPPAEKKTNWGSICLIGCLVLLALGALAGLGIWLAVRWGTEQVERLPQPPADMMELDDQDRDEAPGADPQAEETDGTVEAPSGAEGLGELIGRIGEAVEGAGAAMSAVNVRGFDPSSVDALMLPSFYAFMIALADDNPEAMHEWMSPQMQERWSPGDWTASPHIEHLSFELDEQTTIDDRTMEFIINERIRDNDVSEEGVISWRVEFERVNRRWLVTDFEFLD